jgi:hypothetical protein
MNYFQKIIGIILIVSSVATASHIKVDMDARKDTTADGFLSWLPDDGITKTFGDLTISLTLASPPADTAGKIFWYNKSGINKYELAMDCLYAGFDDGKTNHPSFNGGLILMTITGLSKGPHTVTAYHNALWPVSKYNRTIAACKVSVDNVEKLIVQPSQAVTSDTDVKSSFVTFEAAADKPVQISFEPVGDPDSQLMTAVLNGFEIDRLASVESYANNPVPADGDEHVFANNDEATPDSAGKGYLEMNWKASELAKQQDIYFGTSKTDVEKADTKSADVYKGRQPASTTAYKVSSLDSKLTYYWRIDTVKADGSVTKGYIWTFRTRHLAYPGAEGYGRFARGGRFGRVIEVTTLDDYKPGTESVIDGSLRKAIEVEKGPRVVVFRVGGTIVLKDKLSIPGDNGDIYIAGQTAPGDGICVVHYTFGLLGTNDAIIRFIRTRLGDFAKIPQDGMGMSGSDHCIIDHCSISWSIDEGVSSRSAKNITFSYNIISEALNKSVHYATHSYAGSISGNIGSFHHNLLVHCAGRNWSLAGGLEPDGNYAGYCDIRNNIIYNWKHRTTDGGVMRCNFVNNFYIPGPATTLFMLIKPDGDQMKTGNPQMFYITGNKMEGYPQYDKNNWNGTKPNYATPAQIRSDKPFYPSYVTTQTPEEAYADVIKDAGAIRPKRDAIDTRIIEDVKKRTFTYRGSKENLPGIIDTQEDVGGYPTLKSGSVPDDTDHDGLPDWWETEHNLNPKSPAGDYSDTHVDSNKDGYTNMDDYLDYLAKGGNPFGNHK